MKKINIGNKVQIRNVLIEDGEWMSLDNIMGTVIEKRNAYGEKTIYTVKLDNGIKDIEGNNILTAEESDINCF